MNTKDRRTTLTMTALAFLYLGIALPASNAVGQKKTLKELIVGTWTLDSVYDQTQDGKKLNLWGYGVKGQVILPTVSSPQSLNRSVNMILSCDTVIE
jgi:hypothetical protein